MKASICIHRITRCLQSDFKQLQSTATTRPLPSNVKFNCRPCARTRGMSDMNIWGRVVGCWCDDAGRVIAPPPSVDTECTATRFCCMLGVNSADFGVSFWNFCWEMFFVFSCLVLKFDVCFEKFMFQFFLMCYFFNRWVFNRI